MNFVGTADGYVYYLKAWALVLSGEPLKPSDFPTDGTIGTEAQMALALGVRDAKAATPAMLNYTDYVGWISQLGVPSI